MERKVNSIKIKATNDTEHSPVPVCSHALENSHLCALDDEEMLVAGCLRVKI
jgi:hypothetical protein